MMDLKITPDQFQLVCRGCGWTWSLNQSKTVLKDSDQVQTAMMEHGKVCPKKTAKSPPILICG